MANDFHVPPRKNLMWYAIDLDGTLAWSTWTPDQKRSVIGDPINENIEKLEEVVAQGYKVIIHTSRPWSDHQMIEAWLDEHEITYDQILCGKVLAKKYVDDKAVDARADSWL